MIHHWKALDLEMRDSENHHESACCWVSGAANNISERRGIPSRCVSWKRTSERRYCRIILVARAIARVTGIIRNILYYNLRMICLYDWRCMSVLQNLTLVELTRVRKVFGFVFRVKILKRSIWQTGGFRWNGVLILFFFDWMERFFAS